MAKPTPFDVMVALVGGFAGVIGQTRKEKANTIIPGVAIATCAGSAEAVHGKASGVAGIAFDSGFG